MLQTLRKIIQEMNSATNLSDALDLVVRQVRDETNAEACSVFLVNEKNGEHVLMATAGLNKKLITKLRVKFGEGLIGLVGEREEPINIADTLAHPKFCHYEYETKKVFRAFLGAPIIYQRELLGIFIAQKHEPNSFDENEEAFLVTLSAQLSGIIAFAKATGDIEGLAKIEKELILTGDPTVAGVSLGKIVLSYPTTKLESIVDKSTNDPETEVANFRRALKKARKEILDLVKNLSPKSGAVERALFEAYVQILDSQSLRREIVKTIREGNWAPGALKRVIKKRSLQFEAMEDKYLRERSIDIIDLGQRILTHLQQEKPKNIRYPKKVILAGEEITPAAIAEIPAEKLMGVFSLKGSKTSHTAILCRALNIPTVMGIKNCPLKQLSNKEAIIDGYYGQIYISPNKKTAKEFENLAAQEEELQKELFSIRELPSETKDKKPITLMVNTGMPGDIGNSLQVNADGVGLYRTELPFMIRDRFPSQEEQRAIYRQLLKIFHPKPVVMRTLDIGGDKPLPYFPVKETNPFLGWRGIRITLDHPEIFLVQIRAMLLANIELNNLRIMLPMVSNLNEVEEALRLIKQAYKELKEDIKSLQMPRVGIMVEVPSAIYQARELARRVDFMSVGSNDLTQYLLAVDRNNAQVANLYDSLHPAVLKALTHVAKAAHRERKPVSICGEMAGDPVSALLLLAMGFNILSMNAIQLLKIKWLIRKFTFKEAKQLLADVMQMDDPIEIRYYLEAALEEAGAAGLIRAGK